jgi:phage-related protein
MGFFSDLWSGIKNGVSNLWNKAKDTVTNVWNNHLKPVVSKIPIVGDKIVSGVETVGNALNSGAKAVGSLASGSLADAMKHSRYAYKGVKEGFNKLTTLKKGGKVMTHNSDLKTVKHDGLVKPVYQRSE